MSTDIVSSDVPGEPGYYRAILRLDPDSRDHILKGAELTSGMPAMVMIGIGENTLLSYLIEPLWRSVQDSLREP